MSWALVERPPKAKGVRMLSEVRAMPREGRRDLGMSTAEYAVGMIAAAAFAGLLFKIVTGAEVRGLLFDIVKRALQLAG